MKTLDLTIPMIDIPPVGIEVPKFIPSKNRKLKFQNGQNFEYEIFKLVDEYDSILKTPTIPWDFSNPPGDLRYITISMMQTMMQHNGLGLAANQCGLKYRLFVMGAGQYCIGVTNPVILSSSGEEIGSEGCLSFPGLFLKVPRATEVNVKFLDFNGQEQIRRFDGLTARVFLHEYDHLMGIRYTDNVSKLHLERERRKMKSNLKKIRRAKAQAELQHKIEIKDKASQKPSFKQENIKKENSTFVLETPKSSLILEK